MARKVGQIIVRGDRRWLIRVYLGRDHETDPPFKKLTVPVCRLMRITDFFPYDSVENRCRFIRILKNVLDSVLSYRV